MSRRLVIDTDEAQRDLAGLTPREIGVYVAIWIARAAGEPMVWSMLLQHDTDGWIRYSLRQLRRMGKIVVCEDGSIDIAERRYRHQLRSGEPV